MTDPFQILAQQASQTANLFQAIDKNTQQMFQNKFSVQDAESRLALNTIQLTEQSRVNDARIQSYNEQMKISQKQMEWQQADRAVSDRLLPLKEQAERVRLESSIQANTAARIAPQFDDLKPEIAQAIFDNPELADEIQREYSKSMTQLTQDALSPNVDVVKRINNEKARIKTFVDQKKKEVEFRKNTFGPPDVTKKNWLTNKFGEDPNKPVDVARAAEIYGSFGGDKARFGMQNDPTIIRALEDSARHAKLTGTVDPAKMPFYSREDQSEIYRVAENKMKQKDILSVAKVLNDELTTIKSLEKDSGVEGKYEKEIQSILNKQADLVKQYSALGGIQESGSEEGGSAPPRNPQLEFDMNAVLGGFNADGNIPDVSSAPEAKKARKDANTFTKKLAPIINKILPSDQQISDSDIESIVQGKSKISEPLIEKYVDRSTDASIDTLVRQIWFMDHLKEESLLSKEERGTLSNPYTGSRMIVPTKLGEKINIIQNTEADPADRKEAIKYLKSRLPKILLDYANQ